MFMLGSLKAEVSQWVILDVPKALVKRLFTEQVINPDYETTINQPLMLIP